MTGAEWLDYALKVGLIGLAILIVQRGQAAQGRKIDAVGQKVEDQGKEHGAALTEIKLGLRDCVKWGDLGRELEPVRHDVKEHERRITVVETRCKEQHKAVS